MTPDHLDEAERCLGCGESARAMHHLIAEARSVREHLRSSPPPAPPAGVADESATPEPLPDVLPVGTRVVGSTLVATDRPKLRANTAGDLVYWALWRGHNFPATWIERRHIDWKHYRALQPQTDPPSIQRVEGMASAGLDGVGVKGDPMPSPNPDSGAGLMLILEWLARNGYEPVFWAGGISVWAGGKRWHIDANGVVDTKRPGREGLPECAVRVPGHVVSQLKALAKYPDKMGGADGAEVPHPVRSSSSSEDNQDEAPFDAEDAYLSGQGPPAVPRGSGGDDEAATVRAFSAARLALPAAFPPSFAACSNHMKEWLSQLCRFAHAEGYEKGKAEHYRKCGECGAEMMPASTIDFVSDLTEKYRQEKRTAERERDEARAGLDRERAHHREAIDAMVADMLCELKAPSAAHGYVERVSRMLKELEHPAEMAAQSPKSAAALAAGLESARSGAAVSLGSFEQHAEESGGKGEASEEPIAWDDGSPRGERLPTGTLFRYYGNDYAFASPAFKNDGRWYGLIDLLQEGGGRVRQASVHVAHEAMLDVRRAGGGAKDS